MSRSRRKSPKRGITTARSERCDKQTWHRAFRKAERQRLASRPLSEPHHFRSFSNPWLMDKDGKHYWGIEHRNAKWLRK